MSKAIRIHRSGGPEVMQWEENDVGEPGVGEIRVRHEAVGLNYIDVYFRSGLYPAPWQPFTPGLEAAGVVEAVGEGVDSLAVGDRIAYASPPIGAYAEERLIPADKVVALPESISCRQAAAMMLQGMTAEYLLRRTFEVKAGDTILFHAAAGGVGLIACQWAKALGATVIGTVGSEEKAELAKANGCDHPIVYTLENFAERVKELTSGAGVPVVYDAVGRDTFEGSLDCLAPRGMLVSFGQSSGKIDPVDISILGAKGSLFLTRPSLMTYNASRSELEASAKALFDIVESGQVRIEVNQVFPLARAADAHLELEARRTTGSTVFDLSLSN
ncbi:MAG: quinone oxidoreductase [Ectothiorhodospiraceae bacterium AqS1]|nr:quinone oxidoreductase [Ectothiorhodospiraceae bacterium AqS1]